MTPETKSSIQEKENKGQNYFNIEEKYDKEIVLRENKIVNIRKWKVKDRRNLKTLIEERGDDITPIQLASVLVFPCLKDKNILLTEEEIKYLLTEIRAYSIGESFDFSFICQDDECKTVNKIKIELKDVNKPKFGKWDSVLIDDFEIEFGEVCSTKFYYEKMYDAKKPDDRFLADLALHIIRVNDFDGVIKFEDMLKQFEEMDTELLDRIIQEFKKQRFTQDNIYECVCEKCTKKATFIFDEIPEFFPKSWFE